MLDAARQVLIDSGVLSQGDPLPHFAARMSGNLGLLFYLERGDFYLVKVGLLTRLDREYRGLTAAHRAMPSNVPEPIRLATYRNYQVFVTRGIHHKPLFPFHGAADAEIFREGISSYIATCGRAFRQSGTPVSLDRLKEALRLASDIVQWRAWEGYFERVLAIAQRLSPTLQHGDFAVNNIGRCNGHLVFFDWEDFGEIDLPGFDLAILLLSINGFSLPALRTKLSRASTESDIVRRANEELGLSTSEFLYLFPAYASLYIQTKARLGYPTKVTDRIAETLKEWIRLEPEHSLP